MWIATVNIGLKRMLALVLLFVILAIMTISPSPHISFFLLGVCSAIISFCMYLLYRHGLHRRVFSFHDGKIHKEIRDFIHPMRKRDNTRGIYWINTKNTPINDCLIFLGDQEKWAYFDILRQIIKQQHHISRVLILGGGGGALAYTISASLPEAIIDSVDTSQKMITIANKFMPNKRTRTRIHWHVQDAFAFLKAQIAKKRTFDLIVIDLFADSRTPHGIPTATFHQSLSKIATKHAIVFANFAFESSRVNRLIHTFSHPRMPMEFCLYRGNFIGIHAPTSVTIPLYEV